jgi:hypothetical protein
VYGWALFDWLNVPTTQGVVERGGVAASAVIIFPCLAALRWCSQAHTESTFRRSRWWLALPIFGLASSYSIIILCAALTLVVGALGAARFDPRAPIAAAFMMGTLYLSEYIFLISSAYGVGGNGVSDPRTLLTFSLKPWSYRPR